MVFERVFLGGYDITNQLGDIMGFLSSQRPIMLWRRETIPNM